MDVCVVEGAEEERNRPPAQPSGRILRRTARRNCSREPGTALSLKGPRRQAAAAAGPGTRPSRERDTMRKNTAMMTAVRPGP